MDIFDFGWRLKELREKKGLSQEQVGDRIGVTRSAISGYELNTQTPKLENLIQLAVLYNSSLDYIVDISKETYLLFDGITVEQQETILNMADLLKEQFKNDNKK